MKKITLNQVHDLKKNNLNYHIMENAWKITNSFKKM